jgi:transcription elongation factor Elf1
MKSFSCPTCSSTNISKNGTRLHKGTAVQKFKCKDCKHYFELTDVKKKEEEFFSNVTSNYKRSPEWISEKTSAQRFVITSAQSNTDVNVSFFKSLLKYCEFNDAQLLIIPIRYKNPTSQQENKVKHVYDASIEEYLFENNIRLHNKLKVLGSLKIAVTTEHPLTGLAPVTKGDSIIVGHNQVQSTTIPVQIDDLPVIMTTTGTISEKNYSVSKQGYKAEFNHSNSAVVIEIDDDIFHLRHLNFDGAGFFDLDHYYTQDEVAENNEIYAIVTGDEHVLFSCDKVKASTYGEGGICDVLHPKYVVRHDLLDCFSISHHHKHDFLTRYKKGVNHQNHVENELNLTINHMIDTTPVGSTNIIISSNHNDHLRRWLNECDIDKEPWNARTYHFLMYEMLSAIENNPTEIPSPFELWASGKFEDLDCTPIFLKRTQSFKMFDIEIAAHGDKGANGARGSRDAFANLPSKCIIGHSHSPGIEKGVYQVGTSSILKLEYNDGLSSWLNTHALIYSNGKRQLINIIKGKWRA